MKFAVVLCLWLAVFTSEANNTLSFAVSSFEPWTIVSDDKVSGIDPDLIRRLAQLQGLEVKFYACPWARCLQLVKEGKIDVVSSVFYTKERAEYLSYFTAPYIHGNYQAFYLNAATDFDINGFEQLKTLQIGTRRDVKYFPRFDQDKELTKRSVTYDKQLISMLLRKRIDTFIGQEEVMDYLLRKYQVSDKIKKASYKVYQVDNGYFAFSKKSKLLPLQAQMEKNLNSLIEQGVMEELYEKYQVLR